MKKTQPIKKTPAVVKTTKKDSSSEEDSSDSDSSDSDVIFCPFSLTIQLPTDFSCKLTDVGYLQATPAPKKQPVAAAKNGTKKDDSTDSDSSEEEVKISMCGIWLP